MWTFVLIGVRRDAGRGAGRDAGQPTGPRNTKAG
ncbi:hypothetical protein QFZ53_001060 [Microbacterium natoriense]|uniref:Uncharacterized protein n=1 Tax=Microbacterium natoriense TaxID=284570 RepID=A0AAW8EVD4_9MICO|nr:hypothetical protein [Microbacterium natoriense]